ncbi:hypothetical protein KR067_009631, partial [Drosophila pandora]
VTSEMEDECGSVFYPIVKPLLRYFEVCQTKDRKNAELQDSLDELNLKYSKLLEKNEKVHEKLNEANIKYRQLQESHTAAQRDYHKVDVEFAEVREKFQQTNRELNKSQKILNETSLKNEQLQNKLVEVYRQNARLQEQNLPDRCPSTQDETYIYPEIHLPGLEPFKVCCYSSEDDGSRWMQVFHKYYNSTELNQTYDKYINGFGDVRWDHFIGLEKLHILTSQKPHE